MGIDDLSNEMMHISRDVYAALLRSAPLHVRVNLAIAEWIETRWMAWSRGIYS